MKRTQKNRLVLVGFWASILSGVMGSGVSVAADPKAQASKAEVEAESEAPESRSSGVELMFYSADDSYKNFRLYLDLGLNEDWQLNLSAATESSEGVDNAASGTLGANTYLGESWKLRMNATGRKEPNDVMAFGLGAGAEWVLSDLWDGEWGTTLSLDFSWTQYRQSTSRKGGRLLTIAVPLNSMTLGLSQEISRWVELFGSYTNYSYGSSTAEQLSQALSNRRISLTGLLQVVDGLPETSANLGASVRFWKLTVSPSVYRTRLAYNATLTGLSVPVDFDVSSSWTLSAEFSGSKSDSQPQSMIGLGARYSW